MSPLELASAGDRARAKAAVVAYYDFVWRVLRRHGLSSDEADDTTQEVFAVLATKISFVGPGAEKAYLFQTAGRLAANVRRRRARLPAQAGDEELDAHPDPRPTPESLADANEQWSLLDALLARLPDEQRSVFILCELETMTASEVAVMLDVPPGTVASRLRRARTLLLAWMEEVAADTRKDER
ncbi:RNA polymerase sigma factor RpoE [Labilithrix luteola]|uniref:RNA polymerase sigma factor RpoE n=1 Tax=Labilithrix luteola TaxID=1391654 RepID=A0A0K1PNY2_9BACT|nr:sigma-70 family RNA polymerase sigma factor [Labilithrix luteola]AKU95212.1 RNA polymerase sigma factor RpoE [Labilithrix luteola]